MTYLTRPVFEFPINWADSLNRSSDYDLREVAIGFGAEVFTSLQSHPAHGFSFSLDLQTDAEIKAFDDFFADLNGRLTGFWLPAPMEAMQIVAGISSTQFTIADQKLANTWQDHPAIHLFFSHEGIASKAAKITAVVYLGNGTERITIDTELADWETVFVPEATVARLHYVRLASDVERGQFVAEGWLRRAVQVIELPTE